ncbi:MAG: hypothetical protein ACK481_10725 [Candidatus Melainabacteria bacterium]
MAYSSTLVVKSPNILQRYVRWQFGLGSSAQKDVVQNRNTTNSSSGKKGFFTSLPIVGGIFSSTGNTITRAGTGLQVAGGRTKDMLFSGPVCAFNWGAALIFMGPVIAALLKDIANIGAAFQLSKDERRAKHLTLSDFLQAVGWKTAITTMLHGITLVLQSAVFFSFGGKANGILNLLAKPLGKLYSFGAMGIFWLFDYLATKFIKGKQDTQLILEDDVAQQNSLTDKPPEDPKSDKPQNDLNNQIPPQNPSAGDGNDNKADNSKKQHRADQSEDPASKDNGNGLGSGGGGLTGNGLGGGAYSPPPQIVKIGTYNEAPIVAKNGSASRYGDFLRYPPNTDNNIVSYPRSLTSQITRSTGKDANDFSDNQQSDDYSDSADQPQYSIPNSGRRSS